MCGIVGYIGERPAAPFLLQGLAKLEYRGYDSAGIALMENEALYVAKYQGRLKILREKIKEGQALSSTIGIGHTRWATHGEPSDVNSHPHLSSQLKFAVVHNGIIENYMSLKEELLSKNISFLSETDSEVVAHLLHYYYDGDVLLAINKVMNCIDGSFALGIICSDDPKTLYAVKKDSPLIVGIGKDENYIASDIPALLSETKQFYLVEDNEICVLKKDEIVILDKALRPVQKEVFQVDWDVSEAQKGGYPHFMLKEINEQQKAVNDTISSRIVGNKIEMEGLCDLSAFSRIRIVACGSAYHVGMLGKYLIERLARIPVEVDVASEFRYKDPILEPGTLFLTISQSGETADTLAALREAKKRGVPTLSIVNVLGSSIARESDYVIYTHAGLEIAVATTKAFSAQLSVIYLLALKLSKLHGTLEEKVYSELLDQLNQIPVLIEEVISNSEKVMEFAKKVSDAKSVFFIGRDIDYAIGMEGSLKLKEISYIHSEAYAAGELKHGTISLIEPGVVVAALATQSQVREKTISNIKEVKTRGAYVFAIANEGDEEIKKTADFVYYIPKIAPVLSPLLSIVPLQVFAYCVAKEKGCDIDKPRNLAKSVTVE